MTRDEEAAQLGALPVEGFPGYYVARDGAVYSAKKLREREPLRMLKPGKTGPGYHKYGFVRDGKTITVLLHRVVASAFLVRTSPDERVVRHLDGNPDNNRCENLAWGTQLDNIHDKWRHGTMATGDRNGLRVHPESVLRGERSTSAKLKDAEVREIRERLMLGETGDSLAREFGVVKTTISAIRRAKNWRHESAVPMPNGVRRGESHPVAKLDEVKVRDIKLRLRRGAKAIDLCREFSVSPPTISAIRHGTTWSHVEIDP
jgi:transposase-like protein